MKFKYDDRVKIKSGFYRGRVGDLIEFSSWRNKYNVLFIPQLHYHHKRYWFKEEELKVVRSKSK